MLCLSVFIASASFAAAFTPPGKNASMALFGGKSSFLLYVETNSMSFYLSTIATCLLIHASLATTPRRRRRSYLVISAYLVLLAVHSLFLTFTNVVWPALDPQKSWDEYSLFYFTYVLQKVAFYWVALPWSVVAIPVCLRVWMRLRMSNHRWQWQDIFLVLLAAGFPSSTVYRFIAAVIKSAQLGDQEFCSWPGCRDAIFLHPT